MLELLKVQLSRIVLDKVIYNTISCTVFFIKVWYQFQHNFSNTSYFFSLLSIFIFFGKIYRFWPTMHFSWLALKKKTYKTRENIIPNFFSRIATESGLLGPKIALWYFSHSQILHVKKETVFSGQTGWTSFCSKYSQKFS